MRLARLSEAKSGMIVRYRRTAFRGWFSRDAARPLVAVGALPANGRCSNEQTRMSLRSSGLRLLSVVVELEWMLQCSVWMWSISANRHCL